MERRLLGRNQVNFTSLSICLLQLLYLCARANVLNLAQVHCSTWACMLCVSQKYFQHACFVSLENIFQCLECRFLFVMFIMLHNISTCGCMFLFVMFIMWCNISTCGCMCYTCLCMRMYEYYSCSFLFQGRVDDNIETIRKRFKVFLESSIPVVNHYDSLGKVRKVRIQS